MSINAFWLWYEYLKRTDPNTWSEEVRKDFEGVLTKDSFNEWWGADVRLKLFAKYNLRMTENPVRVLRRNEKGDDINRDTHIALVIDISQPKDVLMKKISSRLALAQGQIKSGRPKWAPSKAKYPFAKKPDVVALKITLDIYDIKKNNPDWPNWRVGQEAQLIHEATNPILRKQMIKENDTPAEIVAKKKILGEVTARYLKRAEALLINVTKGIFPEDKINISN